MLDRTAVLGALSEEIYKRMIGLETEERVLDAITEGPMPKWYRGYRRATAYEDIYRLTDGFVQTDLGDAPVQLKTSYDYLVNKLRMYNNAGILVLVAPPRVSARIIRTDAVRLVEHWRQCKLERMPRWHPSWTFVGLPAK